MIIEKYISKLLFEHDCVIVPGFGGFIANSSPAIIHPVHHTFSPPSRHLAFNASLCSNDGLLADAIRTGRGISFTEAADLVASEVAGIIEKLGNHEKVSLAKIGIVFYDKEKNIQFNPDLTCNYNSDSFGLTTFTSSAIKREALHEKISRKLVPHHAVRSARRLPATLKWAAVFLPLVSIGLWSAFNPGKISSFYNNYATFLPSGNNTVNTSAHKTAKTQPETKVITNLPVQTTVRTDVTPADDNRVIIEVIKPDVYFIIAGAFSIEENAQRLAEELRKKGFDSFIAGQNRRGLYRVSVQGFNDKKTALQKMNEYRNGEFPGAWLLSME
ncbi:MAG: SPOR domain-containing protein [Bacteroidota bacterium]